jgi:hypothetical protein
MSDTDLPGDEGTPEPSRADEATDVRNAGLQIIPGGFEPDESDTDGATPDQLGVLESEAVSTPESVTAEQPPAAPETNFTLDELVAEMAGVSAAVTTVAEEEPVPVQRVDPLAMAMQDAFEETPVESEMWTRMPFWTLGAVWVLFVGVITYLLWPAAKLDLTGTQLYGVLVYGGAALVALGAVTGLIVWSRARNRCALPDRGVVGRALLLRAVGWTATGVALWVVSMIVLSLHSLDVIH